MIVKIISLEKCAATPQTIKLVRETAAELGISIRLVHIIVKTREDAASYRHIGSPTVQINGLDIEPAARASDSFGIT